MHTITSSFCGVTAGLVLLNDFSSKFNALCNGLSSACGKDHLMIAHYLKSCVSVYFQEFTITTILKINSMSSINVWGWASMVEDTLCNAVSGDRPPCRLVDLCVLGF